MKEVVVMSVERKMGVAFSQYFAPGAT